MKESGDVNRAIKLLKQAYDLQIAIYKKKECLSLVSTLNSLAVTQYAAVSPDASLHEISTILKQLEEAASIAKECGGPCHIYTLRALLDIAFLRLYHGDHERSEVILREIQTALGTPDVNIPEFVKARAYRLEGSLLHCKQDFTSALDAYEMALEYESAAYSTAIHTPEHFRVVRVQVLIGMCKDEVPWGQARKPFLEFKPKAKPSPSEFRFKAKDFIQTSKQDNTSIWADVGREVGDILQLFPPMCNSLPANHFYLRTTGAQERFLMHKPYERTMKALSIREVHVVVLRSAIRGVGKKAILRQVVQEIKDSYELTLFLRFEADQPFEDSLTDCCKQLQIVGKPSITALRDALTQPTAPSWLLVCNGVKPEKFDLFMQVLPDSYMYREQQHVLVSSRTGIDWTPFVTSHLQLIEVGSVDSSQARSYLKETTGLPPQSLADMQLILTQLFHNNALCLHVLASSIASSPDTLPQFLDYFRQQKWSRHQGYVQAEQQAGEELMHLMPLLVAYIDIFKPDHLFLSDLLAPDVVRTDGKRWQDMVQQICDRSPQHKHSTVMVKLFTLARHGLLRQERGGERLGMPCPIKTCLRVISQCNIRALKRPRSHSSSPYGAMTS
jgi:hypothetical protein